MSERLSYEIINLIASDTSDANHYGRAMAQELKERRDAAASGSSLSVCIDLVEEILLYPKSWDDPESLDNWRKRLAEIKARQ